MGSGPKRPWLRTTRTPALLFLRMVFVAPSLHQGLHLVCIKVIYILRPTSAAQFYATITGTCAAFSMWESVEVLWLVARHAMHLAEGVVPQAHTHTHFTL